MIITCKSCRNGTCTSSCFASMDIHPIARNSIINGFHYQTRTLMQTVINNFEFLQSYFASYFANSRGTLVKDHNSHHFGSHCYKPVKIVSFLVNGVSIDVKMDTDLQLRQEFSMSAWKSTIIRQLEACNVLFMQ